MPHLDQFESRLFTEWLEPFCTARGFTSEGFVRSSLDKLCSHDAQDFMYALDHGLVTHKQGTFYTVLSKAKEQIFWEGAKDSQPRSITLWLEPIITIAGLARLHRDFGWAASRIGLQSSTWAFDLVGYREDLRNELLVCEVKKTTSEVEKLIGFMLKHANAEASVESTLKGAELNAFRKALALRQSTSTVFWALGPNRYSRVFQVRRDTFGVSLLSSSEMALDANHETGAQP